MHILERVLELVTPSVADSTPLQPGCSMSKSEEALDLIDALRKERARGNTIRLVTTGGVLLSVLMFFGSLYSKANNFDADGTMMALRRHGQSTVVPLYTGALQKVGAEAVPAITTALQDEAETLLPRVSEALSEEAEVFQVNMGKHIESSLEREFRSAMNANEEALKAKYPEFAIDEETFEMLSAKLDAGFRNWAQNRLDNTFGRHVALLESINQTIQVLQQQEKEQRGKDGKPPEVEEALVILSEIMNARVGG